MAASPQLSIIIPAYNEAATITQTIARLASFLFDHMPKVPTEVLICVGKSSDDTLRIATESAKKLEHFRVIDADEPHEKGHNVQVGMQHATGEYRLYMDADLATPLHHIPAVLPLLQKNDIVVGQRNLRKVERGKGHRRLISVTGNYLIQALVLPGFGDTQCGFKAFRAEVAGDLFAHQSINSWGFDIELLALAKKRGYRIGRLVINDWQEIEGGAINESPLKAASAAISTLRDLLKIRWRLSTKFYER
ncbi:MAG TPA: glycosyltransferase [Candidatus Saccharimonadales bacterium]|jgi:glycosyltransferase involved in cell wall biosynthesis|nr:glycosyltransferase [Candidatus Saccharimonadales bacterium]